jgi:carboxyl-terminal processing protease
VHRAPALGALFYALPVLALVCTFAAGYLLGQVDALSGQRPLPALLRQAGLNSLAASVPVATGEAGLTAEDRERFAPLWEAWGLVNREFYDPRRLDRQRMVYGAVRGMLQSLDDPYTTFTDPVHGQITEGDLRGSFGGVGVQVDLRDDRLTVVAPLEGSPGLRAGIKPGDVIVAVDGKSIVGMSLGEAVLLIRGPEGSPVTLTVERGGAASPLQLTVTREVIKVNSVRSRMLDGGIGYLRITSFTSQTGSEMDSALKALMDQHPRGLVLDLRSNPGGYVSSAVDVVSQFLDHGVVLYQQPADGQREPINVHSGGLATSTPLVVLVDHGSASASEIVAAALRDNRRATLVGQPTFGKGTMQSIHELSDRSNLRITSAQWLTPSGAPLHGNGLVPDLMVEQPDNLAPGQDPQLSAAVQRLVAGA